MKLSPNQRIVLANLARRAGHRDNKTGTRQALLRRGLIEFVDGQYRLTPAGWTKIEDMEHST